MAQPRERDQILLEPYRYLCSQPGKEIRSLLIEAFDYWLKVPIEKLDIIKNVVQMLHNASLLVDDVEDESTLRRGVPVANKIYGTAQTINCANYVYFLALEKLLLLENSRCVKIFVDELLNLHRGQGMDIYWRDSGRCPSQEEYFDMIENKTGGLLRLAVKLMQECATQKRDFVKVVNLIGRLYQIRDDYINLQSEDYMKNKSFCEDLTEGKFSLPIIHSIQASGHDNRQLLHILKQRTSDIEIKKYALEMMEKTNSFEYTLEVLRETCCETRNEIDKLGGNHKLSKILDSLDM